MDGSDLVCVAACLMSTIHCGIPNYKNTNCHHTLQQEVPQMQTGPCNAFCHAHTNHFTAVWTLSGTIRVSQYQKKYSPTHTYRSHQSSLVCFIHLLRSMVSSLFNPRTWQSFSTISLQFFLVYLLAWHLPLHTPYISSSTHCLLFATHAHTIAACFAVLPRLCHLILVSLSPFTWNVIL